MLHYTQIGSGQPIVLLHGFPNNSSAWDFLVPYLRNKYKLILPDLPGSGKSENFNSEPTIAYMANKVIEVLDYEKTEDCIFVGHSMGGYTALEIASRFPDRVKALCLIHSSASQDSEEKKINRKKSISLMTNTPEGKEAFLRAMIPNLYTDSFVAQQPAIVEKTFKTGMSVPAQNLASFYTAIMNRNEHLTTLENATYPVLWILGAEDKATPLKDNLHQTILSEISYIKIYENCGHSSMEELPERLAEDLSDFFENLPSLIQST